MAALTTTPDIVLDVLWRKVAALSNARRYEEAANMRDRATAFSAAVTRQRLLDQLRGAGDLGVQLHHTVLHIVDGVLHSAHRVDQLATGLELPPPEVPAFPAPLPRHAADEVLCLARALERASHHARLLWCSGEWVWPSAPVREVTRLDRVA